uniref:Uncharacterized protein n=1 Tax=Hyaloperonospora arabidopsidis (strain Emoy2) TaxID=559515 RepID=M4BXM1_HYAAE
MWRRRDAIRAPLPRRNLHDELRDLLRCRLRSRHVGERTQRQESSGLAIYRHHQAHFITLSSMFYRVMDRIDPPRTSSCDLRGSSWQAWRTLRGGLFAPKCEAMCGHLLVRKYQVVDYETRSAFSLYKNIWGRRIRMTGK